MQYKVVRHAPRQNVKQIAGVIIALLASLFIGLVVGQWFGKDAIFANSALAKQLAIVTDENQELQKSLVAAELASNVQEQAARGLQTQLTELLTEKAELEDAVSFYRDLMEVGNAAEGIRVADFALFATNTPSVYQFSILVTQVADKRKYVGGEVIVKVLGLSGEKRETVVCDQASAVVGFPLKYRFRYFQDLVGQLKLPDGFTPERVSISVQQKAKGSVNADFEWAIEQAQSDVAEVRRVAR